MKLPYLQLSHHLTRKLAPIYLVTSDELLLAQETIDAIRTAAHLAGFTERVKITPESGSDWSELIYSDTHSLSLFSTKKIVEVNLALTKLNSTSGKLLAEYAMKPLADTLIIINTPKLDTKTEQSKWYQAIEKAGVVIPIWPLTREQLPTWMIQRAKKLNLTITKPAADRLASLVEGNILAASQEIEKLSLLQNNNTITEQLIDEVVTDHSHFDIFNLVDSALLGNTQRSLHILKNLAAENEEPALILWALVRELRMLEEMQQLQKKGQTLNDLFSQFRIWEKRKPSIRAFLQRHSLKSSWKILIHAAKIDRMIKGAENGHVWNELECFLIKLTFPASSNESI
jgi:DNA polymerase III subunit delta